MFYKLTNKPNDRRSNSHAYRRPLDLFTKTSGDFQRGSVGVRVNQQHGVRPHCVVRNVARRVYIQILKIFKFRKKIEKAEEFSLSYFDEQYVFFIELFPRLFVDASYI